MMVAFGLANFMAEVVMGDMGHPLHGRLCCSCCLGHQGVQIVEDILG